MSALRGNGAVTRHSSDEFYEELTRRNKGIVSEKQQTALRDATILVAGCGSVGGAVVQPLTRLGARGLLLADPGKFELNNLNRQQATVRDIDRNKAVVAGERALEINPHARVEVFAEGVNADNVPHLLAQCGAIIDGVDVTTVDGLGAKFLLHEQACRKRLPLITGWDMAGAQYLQLFDYRVLKEPFNGMVTARDVTEKNPWQIILRLIPERRIPTEMLAEVSPELRNAEYSVPQVVYAALLFGAVASHMVARILAGERVRSEVYFDLHDKVRPMPEQVVSRLRWPLEGWKMRRARRGLLESGGESR